jgi:quercetin dioxygenase-like cupin family protein
MATTTPAVPYAVAPGAGEAVWFLGTLMTVKATGEQTNGALGLIEQTLPPGFAAPPHIHRNEDEAFYILEGQFTFYCGDQTFPASAGSLVFLPRGTAHHFRVEGDTPARLLQLNMPGGLEHFFVEAAEPAAQRTLPPPGPPAVGPVLTLSGKYNVEILGPPPGH